MTVRCEKRNQVQLGNRVVECEKRDMFNWESSEPRCERVGEFETVLSGIYKAGEIIGNYFNRLYKNKIVIIHFL